MKLAVGVFVLILFITISTFVILLLEEKGTFDKRFNFYFTANSASSFNVGMHLDFSGFNIGVIDNISLEDNGNVIMTFSVSQKNRKWISNGTYLLLKKPLIGSAHIEVHSTIGNEPLQPESIIEIKMSDDINDMISKLEPAVDNIIHIISHVETLTQTMSAPNSDIMQVLHNMNTFSTKLAKDDALLTTITGDINSTNNVISSLNQLNTLMQELNKISSDISLITQSLDSKIIEPSSSVVNELDIIMKDVTHKLETLNATVNEVGGYDKELKEIKEQISSGLVKSNQIMDKVDAILVDESTQKVELP